MMSPLIDAVFLLLVFFLVATMLKKEKKDIDIIPPESSSTQRLLPDDDLLVLGVNIDGDFFWEGIPVSLNELHHRLREVSVITPERRIRLDADYQTPFLHVVQILDLAQFNRMNNVGIRTYDPKYNR